MYLILLPVFYLATNIEGHMGEIGNVLNVYPNPFNDLFNIYLSDISSADILDIRLYIYNLSGQKIPIECSVISLSNFQMNIVEDTPGMYILQLITKDTTYETAIIKL